MRGGARFGDACRRDAYIGIVDECAVDQAVELNVPEPAPPGAVHRFGSVRRRARAPSCWYVRNRRGGRWKRSRADASAQHHRDACKQGDDISLHE